MSNTVTQSVTWVNEEVLRAALGDLGWTVKANVKNVTYIYNKDKDKIYDLAASREGINYGVGFERQTDGVLKPEYDADLEHDKGFVDTLGKGLNRLKQAYSKHLIQHTVAQHGGLVIGSTMNGSVLEMELEVTV